MRRCSLALALLVGLLAPGPPADATAFPGGDGRIAFVSNRDGGSDIYTMLPDGSDVRRLTFEGFNQDPSYSPDGAKIVYASDRDNGLEIWVMDADGGNKVQLTNNNFQDDIEPTFSPGGDKIAFASARTGNLEIFQMAPDGSGQVQITTNPGIDTEPSWSPDGDRIAFTRSELRTGTQIFTMKSNGTDLRPLTAGQQNDSQPDWTPDGGRVAFRRNLSQGQFIFTMLADGSGQSPLPSSAGFDCCPAYSPAGGKIAWSHTTVTISSFQSDIIVAESDGSSPVPITGPPFNETQPAWQPTGSILQTTKVVAQATVPVGGTATYTIRVSNPNAFAVSLVSIVDILPAGFTYVAGSTTGATTANPAISGSTLRWGGPFSVPGNSLVSLSFKANVGSNPGTFFNNAHANPSNPMFVVDPTGDTAPVTVTASGLAATKTADAPSSRAGEENGYTIRIDNPNAIAVTLDKITDTLPEGFTYLPGSSSGVTTANPGVVGQDLTWTGTFVVPANGFIALHFRVRVSEKEGLYFNTAGGIARGTSFTVASSGPTAPIRVFVDAITIKEADTRTARVGRTDGFTITVANPNSAPITLIKIEDTPPPGFSYVAGSTTGLTTADPIDNGLLAWNGPFTVPPRKAVSLHFVMRVAPIPEVYTNVATAYAVETGVQSDFAVVEVFADPLVTTKVSSAPFVRTDGVVGYTITIANPNAADIPLEHIEDTLPAGFGYVAGSTSGVTTDDPSADGRVLRWDGPFNVPALGSIDLSFDARAASTTGRHCNEASALAAEQVGPVSGVLERFFIVNPTGATACVDVRKGVRLVANPALVQVMPGGEIFFPFVSATLTEQDGPAVAGREIVFVAGANTICHAVTNEHGVAGCGGTVEELYTALALGYEATFLGDAQYLAATDDGGLVAVNGTELP